VNIDAIQQRPADLAQVALDHGGRAAALARGIAEEAALAGVHVSTATEYEPGVPGGNQTYWASPDINAAFAHRAPTLGRRRQPGLVADRVTGGR